MALSMADSVTVANLPGGFDCYAGYVAGSFTTWPQLKVRFAGKHLLSITPFAEFDAQCLDVEPGDATNSQVAGWVKRQLTRGEALPCLYTSASNVAPMLGALRSGGIARTQIRLWSAHYGLGPHICGPASCAYPGVPACDGTQYTMTARGARGSLIDASVLHDDFFTGGAPVSATGPEKWDAADWQAFREHQLWNLTRAATGSTAGLSASGVSAVENVHKALLALVPGVQEVAQAVVAALPAPAAGGLTEADVEQAVAAVFARAFTPPAA